MQLVLGIDTGGTYTDSVILDMENGRIVTKAKALTTKENLSIGVRNSLRNLDLIDYEKISMVSLSTTLATNAVVENKGGAAGLIIIGPKTDIEVPVTKKIILAGGHDIHGISLADLDLLQAEKAIMEFQGKVDAIAISSYLSVRNPEHEIQVERFDSRSFRCACCMRPSINYLTWVFGAHHHGGLECQVNSDYQRSERFGKNGLGRIRHSGPLNGGQRGWLLDG